MMATSLAQEAGALPRRACSSKQSDHVKQGTGTMPAWTTVVDSAA